MNQLLLAIVLMVSATSCGSSKKPNENTTTFQTVEEAAEHHLTGKITYLPNTNNTYVLCTSKAMKNKMEVMDFVVVRTENMSLIKVPKGNFREITWASSEEIKVDYIPGTPESGKNDYSYLFNVVSQKKINSTSNNKP